MAVVDRRIQRQADELGENLGAWRKLLHLTAEQVADRAGISRKTLSRLERGESVSSHTLLAVARALGVAERLIEASDPWQTDLGRLRSEQELPKRVRHRG